MQNALNNKNIIFIKRDPSNGTNDTIYTATFIKYPNNTQLISWSNLFFSNFERKIKNCNTSKEKLNKNVVIPMSMLVISEREYATEVTGVVPRVDII